MKVLAVTCYTGGKELVDMTTRCLKQLRECASIGVTEIETSVVAQGADHALGVDVDHFIDHPENVGFAFGMNAAIDNGARWGNEPDFVLCFNNDLQFPHKDWLRKLFEIADEVPNQVLMPATDKAATRTQPGPRNKDSYPVQEGSAYCWLLPFTWCKWLRKEHGFWLFDEDFAPAYGEDNWTAFLLSKQFGPKTFRYVPRSFVKHLRARTSRTIKHDRKKTSRLLVDKLIGELKDPGLRADLRRWANRYIAILTKRT